MAGTWTVESALARRPDSQRRHGPVVSLAGAWMIGSRRRGCATVGWWTWVAVQPTVGVRKGLC